MPMYCSCWAEALGETDESYNRINEVRTRAGLPDIDVGTPGTFTEKLLHERQVELAFENHRWPDIRRFSVVVQQLNAAEPGIETSLIRNLFYIPQREMDINPNFCTKIQTNTHSLSKLLFFGHSPAGAGSGFNSIVVIVLKRSR